MSLFEQALGLTADSETLFSNFDILLHYSPEGHEILAIFQPIEKQTNNLLLTLVFINQHLPSLESITLNIMNKKYESLLVFQPVIHTLIIILHTRAQ